MLQFVLFNYAKSQFFLQNYKVFVCFRVSALRYELFLSVYVSDQWEFMSVCGPCKDSFGSDWYLTIILIVVIGVNNSYNDNDGDNDDNGVGDGNDVEQEDDGDENGDDML